jgi:trimeric autotransporter adhesin
VTKCGTGTVVDAPLAEVSRQARSHGGHAKVEHGNNSPAEFSQILGEQVVLARETTNANKEASEEFKASGKNHKATTENLKAATDDSMPLAIAESSTPKTSSLPSAIKKSASQGDAQILLAKGEQNLSPQSCEFLKGKEQVAKQEPHQTALASQSSDDKSSRKVQSDSDTWPLTQKKHAAPTKVSIPSQNQPTQAVADKLQQTIGADIAATSPVKSSESGTDDPPSEEESTAIVPLQVSDAAEQSSQTTAHVAPKSSTQNTTAYQTANSHRSSPAFKTGVPQRAQSSLGRVELSSQQHSTLSTQEPAVDASVESLSDGAPQLNQPDHNTPTPESTSNIQEASTPRQVSSHRISPINAASIKTSAVSAAAQEPKSDAIKNASDQAQSSEVSTSDSSSDESIRSDDSQTSAAMVAALHASNQSLAPSLVQGQVPAKASTSTHESPETSPVHPSSHDSLSHARATAPISPTGSAAALAKATSNVPESNDISIQAQHTSNAPTSEATGVWSRSQEAYVTAKVASASKNATSTAQASNIAQLTASATSSRVDQTLKVADRSDEASATAKSTSDDSPATVKIFSDKATATDATHSDKAFATVKIVADKAPAAAGSVEREAPSIVKILSDQTPVAAESVTHEALATARSLTQTAAPTVKIVVDEPSATTQSPTAAASAAVKISTNQASVVPDKAPASGKIVTDETAVSSAITSEEGLPAARHAVSADTHTTLHVESTTQSLPLTDKDKSAAPLAEHTQPDKGAVLPSAHEQTTQVQAIASGSVTPSNTPTSLFTLSLLQEPRRPESKTPLKVSLPTAPMPVAPRAQTTEQVAVQASAGGKADKVKTSSKSGSEQAKAPISTTPTAISSEAALAASEQPAASSPIQVKKTPVEASTHTAIKSTAQSTSDPGESPVAEEDDKAESPLVLHTASPTSPSPAPISLSSASSLSAPKTDSSHPMQKRNDTTAPLPSKDVQPAADPTHATKADLPSPIAAPSVPTTAIPSQATLIFSNNEAAPIETSKPSAIAAEKKSIIDRAVEDPGLSVNVMPHSAHLSIASNTGDLALHVRIRDGNADVNVSGAMAPLFDSKATEVRAVLAGQGLSLGSYATDQQGGYQGQQGQPDNTPRTNDVLPLPTPRRTTSSTPEVQIVDERRIHVTA